MFHLCLAEEAGGVGLGLAEAAIVFEELGRALIPGPLVPSHLAAGLIDGADDGSVVVGLVERPAPGAVGTGVLPVIVEDLADLDVLCVLSDDGIERLDPATLDATPLPRPMDPLTPVWSVPDLPTGAPVAGPEVAAWWRRDGAVLTAACQVGMAQWACDLAVEYAKGRVAVRPAHRRLPGRQAPLCRHGRPRRAGPHRRPGGGRHRRSARRRRRAAWPRPAPSCWPTRRP